MGERKVLNKYYSPDFDPVTIPKRRQHRNQQLEVRMMLPMSVRCRTCGNYMYKGTKFNSRKEYVIGETYLGIRIFRFYFKCTKCSAEITFKTEPQSSDYVVESGASRNFEPLRSEDDVIKSLEKRALGLKRKTDVLAGLDEMKSMKSMRASVSVDAMLAALQRSAEDEARELEEEDEALVKSVVFQSCQNYVHNLPIGKLNNGKRRQERSQEEPSIRPYSLLVKKLVVSKKNKIPSENEDKSKKEHHQESGLQSLYTTYDKIE